MRTKLLLLTVFAIAMHLNAADEAGSTSSPLPGYTPLPAPQPSHLILKTGDRLAICGDSITEQKMYSRIMEDYLTMCVPQWKITVRQYGWSGERAPGFLARMTNDVLRFKPTIATTCYGMNDHEYGAYSERIGDTYRTNSDAIVHAFTSSGARVILGSAGAVGKVPGWHKSSNTVDDLNQNLGTLRNIDIKLAAADNVSFADVFWPMITGGAYARQKYDTNYNISGNDGVHPNWAGHTVMAYAYLKAMGLDGDIGTFTVDLKNNKMKTSTGHAVVSIKDGAYEIKSTRYPFCPCEPDATAATKYPVCSKDDATKDNSIQSGMTLVPFNQDLNRLVFIAKNGTAQQYKITWGNDSKTFTRAQLEQGINLGAEFPENPFNEAFAKVDAAVAAKQAFETHEMKVDFRPKGVQRPTMEQVAAQTATIVTEDEKRHDELAQAVGNAFVPVTHVIKITAE